MNALIAALLAGLPQEPPPRLIETHISWVILTGQHAYKLKKPLDLGFLDFSSLDKRRACCEAEIRLNRRLAPDIYLGVVPVAKLREFRGYFIVGAFIVAAVVTPPDVISQLALAIPMCVLYEVGIWVAALMIRKRETRETAGG